MKRTKKFKINILDIVIVLVAIACVIGVASRKQLGGLKALSSGKTAIITFSAENVRNYALEDTLHDGDKFYCTTYKCALGELCNRDQFVITPTKKYNESNQGTVTMSELTYRSDILGYIKANGKYDPARGFLLDGTRLITPGEQFEISSANRKFAITVLNVEIVD